MMDGLVCLNGGPVPSEAGPFLGNVFVILQKYKSIGIKFSRYMAKLQRKKWTVHRFVKYILEKCRELEKYKGI